MILAVTIAKTATLGTLALAIAAAPPLRAGLHILLRIEPQLPDGRYLAQRLGTVATELHPDQPAVLDKHQYLAHQPTAAVLHSGRHVTTHGP